MAIEFTKRPTMVKVFARLARDRAYVPVEFGTNKEVDELWDKIANSNYEYGIESLDEDLQLRDLNSIYNYHANLLKYLFEHGAAGFSSFENYPKGALVSYGGTLWVAKEDIKATQCYKTTDNTANCACCSTVCSCVNPTVTVEGTAVPPKNEDASKWVKLVNQAELNVIVKELKAAIKAVDDKVEAQIIENLKDVIKVELVGQKFRIIHRSGAVETLAPNFDAKLTRSGNNVTLTNKSGTSSMVSIVDDRDVKFTNATGDVLLGWAYKTEA